ncbi:nitroreductase/quinone reductase family protein [soil metagenome]
MTDASVTRYDPPNALARGANTLIRWLAEAGISLAGTQVLRVRGRRTGVERKVVINVMRVEGVDYLVSPRGNTEWARNARAAGVATLGPRWRSRTVTLTEVADDAKPPLLQRYLDRWFWEVKTHVGGLTPDSSAGQMRDVAPSIPVFALTY